MTSNEPEPDGLDSDCTVPPDQPVPADQLAQYSPDRDYHAEREIADYVEATVHDETVQHVERVKVEHVMGIPYEVWDVTTDADRYWVLTNGTLLYSRRHFQSLDYTLSFHIGLMTRLRSREEKFGAGFVTPFDEVVRRLAQAEEDLDRAVEVVEFQAVGMQLRECMISLMAAARRRTELPDGTEEPQDANVKAWGELLFNHYCPGSSNDKMRGYLKATTDKAWELVNHLTHHRNANRTAALIAKRAVDTITVHMANILTRDLWDRTEQCPRCESRAVRTYFDPEIGTDGDHFQVCDQCDWSSHPGHEVMDFEGFDPLALAEAQREAVRAVHESWVRNGNELMIEYTANSVAALEELIEKLRVQSDRAD
ncbi:hypothetical protein A5630_10925 [Mycolicibacterium mucogenicum]|uniref:Gamma-glutamylcyclotransferase n=1 Tax=Mycolicibacterium mucogenicum TaxID=56689 RepID=A0A1A3HGZ0_MYCMU|nr:hypothetical protein [Mycolicibacterium mucogenicum]OBJ46846.1 hypothetical protein A5630_10925 [Mycolicibacterium mucogenicum]